MDYPATVWLERHEDENLEFSCQDHGKQYVRKDIADKARADGLTAGIAMAVGLMNRGCTKAQTLTACGIKSKKELREAGTEEFDIENIGDLLPEE